MKTKLPLVTRKRYENERGRIIAYIPCEPPTTQIPRADQCFHDKRIGWVTRKEFRNYQSYINYLKEQNDD